VLERYVGRGVFDGWRQDLLEAFVRDAFADEADGSVTLRCTPHHEVSMLERIFAAMEGTYSLVASDHPFDALGRVRRPTMVVTTEHSGPIYKQMAEVVRRLVHDTSHVHLDGLGHAAAQVDPDRVAGEVLRFWRRS
jgi:pimeloyl-ACP methyl ester carboxylesterase